MKKTAVSFLLFIIICIGLLVFMFSSLNMNTGFTDEEIKDGIELQKKEADRQEVNSVMDNAYVVY